jgi:hypothetical protein
MGRNAAIIATHIIDITRTIIGITRIIAATPSIAEQSKHHMFPYL